MKYVVELRKEKDMRVLVRREQESRVVLPGGGFYGGKQTEVLPGGGFHGGKQTEVLPGGGFHGGKQTEVLPGGGFHGK